MTKLLFALLLLSSPVFAQAGTVFQNGTGFPATLQVDVSPVSTTPYTPNIGDYYVPITTGASAFTINLPACTLGGPVNANVLGRVYVFKKQDTGAGPIILHPSGTDTIEGVNANAQFGGNTSSGVTDTHGQFSVITLVCRAPGAWDVINSDIQYGAALTSATPSTWTVTVPTGSACSCTNATTQANPVKCVVSGTTLTATGPTTVTDVVNATCSF